MTEKVRGKVMKAVRYAEDIGAHEIIEELEGALKIDCLDKCRKDMEVNGMTGYCTKGSCPQHAECQNALNWFSGTWKQPSEPVVKAG